MWGRRKGFPPAGWPHRGAAGRSAARPRQSPGCQGGCTGRACCSDHPWGQTHRTVRTRWQASGSSWLWCSFRISQSYSFQTNSWAVATAEHLQWFKNQHLMGVGGAKMEIWIKTRPDSSMQSKAAKQLTCHFCRENNLPETQSSISHSAALSSGQLSSMAVGGWWFGPRPPAAIEVNTGDKWGWNWSFQQNQEAASKHLKWVLKTFL